MHVIGLTGGIGMGKSTAQRLLHEAGVPVVDTDDLAHELARPGQPALEAIAREFGAEYVTPAGLDRGRMARLVFADATARARLEAILHPLIRAQWHEQVAAWRAEGRPMAVVVIPLLFETGAERELDAVICVACSSATQRQRLAPRGWSPLQTSQRIAAQLPVDQKIARANFLIWTEGSLEVHREQLGRVLRRFPQPK
jgi:dephospho-CoA kinase